MPSSTQDLEAVLRGMHLAQSSIAISENLTRTDGHILHFEYPAFELIKDDLVPHFDPQGPGAPIHDPDCDRLIPHIGPPKNVAQRHEPNADAAQVSLGTQYCLTLELTSAPNAAPQGTQATVGERLTYAVRGLKHHSGSSRLKVMSFHCGGDGPGEYRTLSYLIVLESSFDSTFVPASRQEIWFMERDFKSAVAHFSKREEWLSLLDDLITRKSERAYFEVRKVITNTHGQETADKEQASWPCSWQSKPPPTLKELFIQSVHPVSMEDVETLEAGGEKILEWGSDRSLDLWYPCGHLVTIRKISIIGLTAEGWLREKCAMCKEPVLSHNQEMSLLSSRYEQATKNRKACDGWLQLDEAVDPDEKAATFNTKDVLQGLHLVLKSF